MAHKSGYFLAAVAGVGGDPPRRGRPKQAYTTWSDYGGAADSMQYSALKQINKSNVGKLELAWTYKVPDHRGNFGFNPLVVDGMMYVLGAEQRDRRARRGHRQPDLVPPVRAEHRLPARHQVLAEQGRQGPPPDLRSGQLPLRDQRPHRRWHPSFGDDGRVNMRVGNARARSADPARTPGRILENRIIVARRPARATAPRPATSAPTTSSPASSLWTFHTIPHPGELGYDTWPQGRLDVRRRRQYLGRNLGR